MRQDVEESRLAVATVPPSKKHRFILTNRHIKSTQLLARVARLLAGRRRTQRTKPQNEDGTQETAAPPTLSLARARRSPHFSVPPFLRTT